MNPPRNGEGDQRSWWRGTLVSAHLLTVAPCRLCPSTILRMVPLPVPGRILAAIALTLATPAQADVLVDNVDGLTLTATGAVQRFSGLLIGDDGRIAQIFQRGEKRPLRADYRLDGKGRVLMPGLIDSHVELMKLGFSRIPPESPGARPRPEDRDQALVEAQKILLERGVTTVIDMGTSIEDWQTYRRAGDLGTLSLRIVAYAGEVDDLVLMAGPGPTPWLYDDRLRCNGLRITFSAAPPPSTVVRPARPVARPPEPTIQLKNLLSRAAIDGFQPAVAIRDAASLPVLLDAIAELAQTYKGERRWRIAMPAMPGEADLGRLGQSGAVIDLLPQALAPRTIPAASLATLASNKIRYTLASGTSAGVPNPITTLTGTLQREDAVAALTTSAAWAAFAEGRIGRVAIGQRADFLLVDRDPLLAAASELRSIKVLQTWIGGKLVFQAKDAEVR